MEEKKNIFELMNDPSYRCGAPSAPPKQVKGEEALRLWSTVMRPIYDKDGTIVKKKSTVTPSLSLAMAIEEILNDEEHIYNKFVDEKPSDKEIYEAAGFSRSKWGRIRSGMLPDVERGNVFALALALRLDEVQTEKLLHAAGFSLNYDLDLDCAVMYFIRNEIYDVNRVYRILGEFCDVKNGLDCFMFHPRTAPGEN